jgi:hypothetical protein
MKRANFKAVGEYFSWLIKQYQAVQQKTQQVYLYKIVDKEICKKTQQEQLLIQVAGKNVFLKMTPKEIAADDVMLKGFSSLDVRTITYFACKEHFEVKQQSAQQPKQNILYRIVAMTFSRRKKKQMLVLEQTDKAEVITTSVQTVSNNLEMIDGFSPRDAHKIGYVAGVESVVDESK